MTNIGTTVLMTDTALVTKQKRRQEKLEGAQKISDKYGYFGGQKYLGINKNGKDVWITYKATKDTIEVTSTHDIFSVLPENGGELADQRVRLWATATRGTGYPTYAEIVEKSNKRGRVTKNAILHIEKLIDELAKFTAVGKKPPRTLFRLFAWNIYSGTWDIHNVPNCNWDDLANLWKYEDPESYYFTGQI
jgi:hypothetical protein